MLAGEREHALDHHVVDRHGLHERLDVFGLMRKPLHPPVQHFVEEHAELRVQVLAGLLQAPLKIICRQHAHLRAEAVEERHMTRLVGDLRAEEDPHVLLRASRHHRAELSRDALLAHEERAQSIHPRVPLLGVDALVPVNAVLAEIQRADRPLLTLPQRVELAVAEQLRARALGRLLQRRIARRTEVRPRVQRPGLLLGDLRNLDIGHLPHTTAILASRPVLGLRTPGGVGCTQAAVTPRAKTIASRSCCE